MTKLYNAQLSRKGNQVSTLLLTVQVTVPVLDEKSLTAWADQRGLHTFRINYITNITL